MARTRLDHVLLGDHLGDSPWSRATGRSYDVRGDTYGESDYSITVNHDRIGAGTTGWVCLRDGSFGMIAGVCVFRGSAELPDVDGIRYAPCVLYPLPREYWIDGARIQLSGWSGRAPFKKPPNRFRNGESLKPGDRDVILGLVAKPVLIWHAAVLSALERENIVY